MGKVFKNGNSLAVTIPKAYAHQLNIRGGEQVEWEKVDRGLILKNKTKVKPKGVDQKFAKMVEEFMDEHADVLEELSKR